MKRLFLCAVGAALAVWAAGYERIAFELAMLFSAGELFSLCAGDAYYRACAAETDETAQREKQADAAILMCVGCLALYALAFLTGGWTEYAVNCACGYVIARVLIEMLRVEGAGSAAGMVIVLGAGSLALARFLPGADLRIATFGAVLTCLAAVPGSRLFQLRPPRFRLMKQAPAALAVRGAYLLPAGAACAALRLALGVETTISFLAGWVLFALLAEENAPAGPEKERFPARWLAGGLMTLIALALRWNGVFSGAYCAWAVIAALLFAPGMLNGASVLCAVLAAAEGACGIALSFAPALAVPAACVPLALTALLTRRALYAAWLPVRAAFIRHRARSK